MKISQRSISKNLAVTLSFIVFLVMGALLFSIYCIRSHDLLKMVEQKADEHISRISGILALPLWNIDYKSIKGICTEFAYNELVEEVHIRDAEGKVLYAYGGQNRDDTKITRFGDIVYNSTHLGRAEISLSLEKYQDELRIFSFITVSILIASLLIICISTGWLLRIFLRRPLAVLCEGMDRVARGDFSKEPAREDYIELSGIAERFRKMAQMVADRENAFASANRKLRDEIAERKNAEAALRESEAKFKNLFDVSPHIIILTDADKGKIADANLEFYRVSKLKRENCIGRSLTELGLVPEKLWRTFLDMVKDLGEIRNLEQEIPMMNASPVSTLISAKIVRMDRKDMILMIVMDVTEEKKALREKEDLRERLARSKKMEALGLLAGGVAHDLNNILSGVVSYPDLLLMDIPEDSPMRKPVETIREAGQRAAAVVSDLLTLARGAAGTRTRISLNRIIRDYMSSPEYQALCSYYPKIRLETRLDSHLPDISASPVHMRKIIMNLVVNAFEATEGTGTVRISTENRYIDRPVRGYDEVCIGEYSLLRICDEGCGISRGDLDRIFEPFYTRKVMGRSGTGLGLTIVWNTVRDHQGYIDVESGESGTRFDLYFPVSGKICADDSPVSRPGQYRGKGEKILVVDDEETQRMIACSILRKLGYAAHAADSGETALEYLEANRVDLILLDMIMPSGLSGRETYEKIIRIRPGQKALIASGFSESEDVKKIQAMGAGAYVKKPYTLESMGIALRTELDRKDFSLVDQKG